MDQPAAAIAYADVRALTEAVLRAGLVLSDLIAGLLEELPDDALGGECPVEALLEMTTGTLVPVAAAAGTGTVRDATALLGAVCDRVVADLRAAAELAGEDYAA